ncbi:hypothetical protein Tco_0553993 [Tanacetum coccineum]
MSTTTFSNTHNMVAFFEKPAESDGFHEIIDFLNANQIHYALTVNPTIYTPCIESFGNSKRQKRLMVNLIKKGVIQAFLLLLKQTPITIQPSTSKPLKKQSRRKQKKTTAVPHPSNSTTDVPNEESVPTHSNDPLLSGEDRLKLTDLMDMCTKLFDRVLDLEHTKTAQAQEITNLKLRVKKLEKKIGLRTHKFKRLYKGRSIDNIDKDAEASLVDETQGRSDDAEMFDTDALIGNEVFAENDMIEKDQDVIPKEVSTAAPSTTVVPPPDITEV